jgi:hypothetical protein
MRHDVPIAVLGCSLAVAACGSATKPAATVGSKGSSSFLRFSECMRAHRVSNFPDPSAGGGIHLSAGPSSFNPQSPVVQVARDSCKHLLPGGGPPPGGLPESVKLKLLEQAKCMRAHGVPNFPDPTFRGPRSLPPGLNLSSPAFQRAMKACGGGQVAVSVGPA